MPHTFLSDEWLDAVKALAAEAGDEANANTPAISLNVVVTGSPDGDRHLHMDAGTFGHGHLEDAPTKLTVPYPVARQLFIEGNQQAAMQAFMSGQIKVEGDMSKLMAMQAQGAAGGADAAAFQQRLKDLTLPE